MCCWIFSMYVRMQEQASWGEEKESHEGLAAALYITEGVVCLLVFLLLYLIDFVFVFCFCRKQDKWLFAFYDEVNDCLVSKTGM